MQIQTTFTKFIGYTSSLSSYQIKQHLKCPSIESKLHISNKSNTLRSNKSSGIFSYIGTILAIQFVWYVYMNRMFNWPTCSQSCVYACNYLTKHFYSINHQHAFILLTFSNWCSHFSLILINYQFAATISQGLEVDQSFRLPK